MKSQEKTFNKSGSYLEINITDDLMLQNIIDILKKRYPEAHVNYLPKELDNNLQGRLSIKRNVFEYLEGSVWKNIDTNVSYVHFYYGSPLPGCLSKIPILGLIPIVILMIIQHITCNGFKKEVLSNIERDLKVKYHVDIDRVEKPMNIYLLISLGIIGLLCVFFLLYAFGFTRQAPVDSIITICSLWILLCLFVRYKKCNFNFSSYSVFIIAIFCGVWCINKSYYISNLIVGYDTSIDSYSGDLRSDYGIDTDGEWEYYHESLLLLDEESKDSSLYELQPIYGETGDPIVFKKGYAIGKIKIPKEEDGYKGFKERYYVINRALEVVASSQSFYLNVTKLSKERILINAAEDGDAVLDEKGDEVINYKEYDNLWQLNSTTLVGRINGKKYFLNHDGKEVSTMSTIEYSTNAVIWIAHLLVISIFVLSLFLFSKKISTYN